MLIKDKTIKGYYYLPFEKVSCHSFEQILIAVWPGGSGEGSNKVVNVYSMHVWGLSSHSRLVHSY